MHNSDFLQLFLNDIDKLIAGDLVTLPDEPHIDTEYRELLLVARLLARVDFTPESNDWRKGMTIGDLDDIELDLVAGGINLNGVVNKNDNQDGNM